jgi:hypothetical protein
MCHIYSVYQIILPLGQAQPPVPVWISLSRTLFTGAGNEPVFVFRVGWVVLQLVIGLTLCGTGTQQVMGIGNSRNFELITLAKGTPSPFWLQQHQEH